MKKILIIYSIIAFLGGIVFGLFHYEYLFWQTLPSKQYVAPRSVGEYQKASIFYQKDSTWQEDKITIDINDLQEALFILVQHWLVVLQEEGSVPKTISLQTVLLDAFQNGVYLSFDRSLFFENISTYQKTVLIVSLSKTVASLSSFLQRYVLLVDHEPLIDNHIDCTVPFYIAYWSVL